jgi:cytochrome c oxidase subunit 3
MIIFLGGWAMMFGGLFFAYALVRVKQPMWPPPGEPHLPLALPAVNTALLIGSSAAMQLALRSVRSARPRALTAWLLAALALGAAFVTAQLWLFHSLNAAGLRPDSGIYGSVFYALTGFHGLHVAVGLIGLLTLLPRALRGRFSVQHHTPVRMWTMFWHFVDAVWVLMFVTVFAW